MFFAHNRNSFSACSSCEAKSGCGQGVLARISDGKANQVLVTNTLHLSVGDDVLLGIPEDMLLKASFVVYLVPLILMIIAATIAEKTLFLVDAWVALAGGLGLVAGFFMVRVYSQHHSNDQRFCPIMIRGVGDSGASTLNINLMR